MVNFDKIMEMKQSGMTYYEIWVCMNPPIKYATFERAAIKFRSTGWVTIFRKINNKNRPKPIAEYATIEEAVKLLKDGCRLVDLGPDPIKTTDIVDEVRALGHHVEFMEGRFYICKKLTEQEYEVEQLV